jgi:hypothetical protein
MPLSEHRPLSLWKCGSNSTNAPPEPAKLFAVNPRASPVMIHSSPGAELSAIARVAAMKAETESFWDDMLDQSSTHRRREPGQDNYTS